MKIKVINQYDSQFTLNPEAKEILFRLLTSEAFQQQICRHANCDRVEFTEMLFQPVPYTLGATKGMPVEYEQYHRSPDYVIINVPPNFMFNAKIFQPNRLCAIYKKIES
ncbi:hypothetical protein C7B76_18845 [filamentous cyanobacterium CCP2]|nr:hypothetical protein C7B76_18845 [filamentous cyanobacterium CCP2]